ncbi:MAG: hypothetical protein IMF17_02775 [Proteobacteria bacterium]|nr:hypothetical protein [Pseudomonadota bacterium]
MKATMKTFNYSIGSTIKLTTRLLFLMVALSLMACDPGTPSGETDFAAGGAAAPLSQAEFNRLPAEQQYQVASKLYGTLFRGITADEFFDLSAGIDNLQPRNSNFINDTRKQLSTDLHFDVISQYDKAIDGLDDELSNPDEALARYTFDDRTDLESNQRPRQIPLARIKDYPISRDLYVNWMAYFLANTIMYSPAEEMESSDMLDVQRMYRFLDSNIKEKATIQEMVRSILPSLTRWRVARTSQNFALEAFENYLGLFQDGSLSEAEKLRTPIIASLPESIENAGLACGDLFLTRASDDYLIGQTDFPNTTPRLILEESFVVTCTDVYDVVAGHSSLIPRAAEVIINYFFPGQGLTEKRLAVRQAILNSNPQTYEDIFTAIIFSREYLLSAHRPKSFEENFLPLLDTLKWDVKANVSPVRKDIFERMASNESQTIYLGGMSWNAMSLKIGRLPSVPLDALSFGNYHKAIRESLFLNTASYRGGVSEAGDGLIFDVNDDLHVFIESLSLADYIDYLFLNTLHRKATVTEQTGLYDFLVNTRNYTDTVTVSGVDSEVIRTSQYINLTEEVFDYISRLPELYYFTSIDQ